MSAEPYFYIDSQRAWDYLAQELSGASQLAVDTERNGLYAYRARICLIQLCDGERVFILDPLRVGDLSELGKLLSDGSVMKALHGSKEDVQFFRADFGFEISGLFDTGMAVRLLGARRSNLGAALQEFSGVAIEKYRWLSESNWSLRPLSRRAMAYAADDVRYLLPLADELRRRLSAAGRLGWALEECERLQEAKLMDDGPFETMCRRIKGWYSLDVRQAGALRELYALRERRARAWDLPRTVVASDADLMRLAKGEVTSKTRLGGLLKGNLRRAARYAAQVGRSKPMEASYLVRERDGLARTLGSKDRLAALNAWRREVAEGVGLHAVHVWPSGSLEKVALRPDLIGEEFSGGGEVRNWQRVQFGGSLRDLVGMLV